MCQAYPVSGSYSSSPFPGQAPRGPENMKQSLPVSHGPCCCSPPFAVTHSYGGVCAASMFIADAMASSCSPEGFLVRRESSEP